VYWLPQSWRDLEGTFGVIVPKAAVQAVPKGMPPANPSSQPHPPRLARPLPELPAGGAHARIRRSIHSHVGALPCELPGTMPARG